MLPERWLDLSSDDEALLSPFLGCTSPGGFIELQRGVDMARLVDALEDWSAVRLGARGPLLAGWDILTRKRAAFLLDAVERYGTPHAEVFALFILHSSFDDEVRALLEHLARDRQLAQTLGPMGAVRVELERRGLKLEDFPERGVQRGDVLRGLGRAGRDAMATSPLSRDARYMDFTVKRKHLPLPYQQALDEVEKALIQHPYTPGNTVLGAFDHLTFGVPVGFYSLVTWTGHGTSSLLKGDYEQATRELAPSVLLVVLYAGGKGAGAYSRIRATGWAGMRHQAGTLREVAERLRARLGENGVAELARYIQARREAAVLVGAGGEPAALALHAAKGDVARAHVWLSQAQPELMASTRKSLGVGRALGGLTSMVDEAANRGGILRSVGSNVWESRGGLRYGADPSFGNRVEHVLSHAADIPTRPGAHGVFDAGRSGALGVVDEAWALARAGGEGVTVKTQGARTIYTVDMGRRVGFVGGQAGSAAGNPAASHIRLVIESSADVIAAFPVRP